MFWLWFRLAGRCIELSCWGGGQLSLPRAASNYTTINLSRHYSGCMQQPYFPSSCYFRQHTAHNIITTCFLGSWVLGFDRSTISQHSHGALTAPITT